MTSIHPTFLNYNGLIVRQGEPLFGPGNRAFRYGDGLFESMRIVNGKLMFVDLHTARLQKGMQFLKFKDWKEFNIDFIKETVEDLLRRNKMYKDSRAKISVFRKDGGLYAPETNEFEYLVEVFPMKTKGYEFNTKGLLIDVYTDVPKDPGPLSGFKTSNSLVYVLAGIYKIENKLDECIILNAKGHIVESISSNVFLVKDGQIYTPGLAEGCISGVMRNVVIQIAKHAGIKINEGSIPPKSLLHADEIFMTNAIHGIQWVVGYGTKRYFNTMGRMLLERLMNNR